MKKSLLYLSISNIANIKRINKLAEKIREEGEKPLTPRDTYPVDAKGLPLYPSSQGVRVPPEEEASFNWGDGEGEEWVLPRRRPLSEADYMEYAKEIFSISSQPHKRARYFIHGSRVWIRDLDAESEEQFVIRVASNKDHNITIDFFVPKDE